MEINLQLCGVVELFAVITYTPTPNKTKSDEINTPTLFRTEIADFATQFKKELGFLQSFSETFKPKLYPVLDLKLYLILIH